MSEFDVQQFTRLLADPSLGKIAPRVLWRPMGRLAGDLDRVVASAASCREGGDNTEWAVVWLTSESIIFGGARKSIRGEIWSMRSEDQGCEDVTVWSRAVERVRSIAAVDVAVESHRGYDEEDKTWSWREGYQVQFDDGRHPRPAPVRQPLRRHGRRRARTKVPRRTRRAHGRGNPMSTRGKPEVDLFVHEVQMSSGSIGRGDEVRAIVTLKITPYPVAGQPPQPVTNVHIPARVAEDLAGEIVRMAHEARDRVGD